MKNYRGIDVDVLKSENIYKVVYMFLRNGGK